ncbi:hypothetical protein M8818_007394 [Zalaria obscura]|uniref:Uncharacterized protein n=1 Tax=Zalaria obscura TaxID=2024903 RepID=A0ACC3S3Q3_9PEZI
MPETIILGAGIIGLSTAYYLTHSPSSTSSPNTTSDPHTIHLLDASPTLFASASGYAGGFLAADWFSPPAAPLGALSFALHAQLAAAHAGRESWGYSASTCASVALGTQGGGSGERGDDWLRTGGSRGAGKGGVGGEVEVEGPAWLSPKGGYEVIGEEGTTAQVDPGRLCGWLLERCREKGVRVEFPARAVGVVRDGEGVMMGVRVRYGDGDREEGGREEVLRCDRLLIAAGAWSPRVFRTLFPEAKVKIPIEQLAGHSIVVRSPYLKEEEEKGCHAIFSTSSAGFSPEVFSRVGGDIYVAGLNDSSLALPDKATEANISDDSIEQLKKVARDMLVREGVDEAEAKELEVVREGLCFRPVTRKGTPILTQIADGKLGGIKTKIEGGVFLAAGHGPWGISLSLGTGKVMAEMMERQPTSADVSGLGL